MRKLLAGFLTLSLVLAACGNDDSKKEDENSKDKDKTTEESKTKKEDSNKEKESKSEDSKSDDSKSGEDKSSSNSSNSDSTSSDNSSSDNNASNTGSGSTAADNSNTDNAASSNSQNNQQSANEQAVNTNTGANNNQNAASGNAAQNNQSTAASQTGYVAPYQSANAVPAASTLVQAPADNQTALKNLPNFPQSLATAQNEANALNGQQNAYNDYGIESLGNGRYSYVFSFANQAQPGTYTIVSVNQQGQASILDPAYSGQ